MPGGTPGIRPGGMLPEISAVGTTGSSLYPGLGTLLYNFLCSPCPLWLGLGLTPSLLPTPGTISDTETSSRATGACSAR